MDESFPASDASAPFGMRMVIELKRGVDVDKGLWDKAADLFAAAASTSATWPTSWMRAAFSATPGGRG